MAMVSWTLRSLCVTRSRARSELLSFTEARAPFMLWELGLPWVTAATTSRGWASGMWRTQAHSGKSQGFAARFSTWRNRSPQAGSSTGTEPTISGSNVVTDLAPSDINFEVQHGVSSRIAFLRGPKAKPLPRSAVQFRSDLIAIVLGEVSHALALGQILAHEAIGVLVGAAFPGMMRRREVEAGRGGALEPGVVVEFGAVIDGARSHGMRLGGDELLRARIHRRAGALA